MSGPKTRRRRLAIGVTTALAIVAFAFGTVLGDRDNTPAPSAASRLSLRQLAGERLVAGFQGTMVPGPLRRMIRRGGLAAVILFAENLPNRVAARDLVGEIESIRRRLACAIRCWSWSTRRAAW